VIGAVCCWLLVYVAFQPGCEALMNAQLALAADALTGHIGATTKS